MYGLVDAREHLSLADPVAGFHRNGHDAAAFTDNAHRHFAARRQSTRGCDFAIDRRPARGDHGHGRRLCIFVTRRRRRARAAQDEERHDRHGKNEQSSNDDDPALLARGPFEFGGLTVEFDRNRLALFSHHSRFVVHLFPAPVAPRICGVLHAYIT